MDQAEAGVGEGDGDANPLPHEFAGPLLPARVTLLTLPEPPCCTLLFDSSSVEFTDVAVCPDAADNLGDDDVHLDRIGARGGEQVRARYADTRGHDRGAE